jgi:glycosyltransferase involved in cell wall biosynthesis
VASAIEGYANVARADRDALLVPAGDVGALQDALRRVFDDPALRERLVAEGRARAEEFSMARLAERYLELYERALVPAR